MELTDYPRSVVEGEAFSVYLNVYRFSYPRSRQRVYFVPDVTLFAEAVPVDGIPAVSAADFNARRKVLLGAVSPRTTAEAAAFPEMSFSTHVRSRPPQCRGLRAPAAAFQKRKTETCPVSTGGGTRRVQSVREGGGGGGLWVQT